MKQQTYLTSEEILYNYTRLSYKKRNEILDSAIDYMQQYSGRSKILCIALAMGYDQFNDKYYKNER